MDIDTQMTPTAARVLFDAAASSRWLPQSCADWHALAVLRAQGFVEFSFVDATFALTITPTGRAYAAIFSGA